MAGALQNCTVVDNTGGVTAGIGDSGATNCIVYYNVGGNGNYAGSGLDHCCTTPDPGAGNSIADIPGLVDRATK